MADDLDDFTAQLNAGKEGAAEQKATAPGGPQQNLSQEQQAVMAQAQKAQMDAASAQAELKKQVDAKPLTVDPLKGKVDVKWFGHAGFKIQFMDTEDKQRVIYIDIWIDNKDCPDEEKKECPNDADLILVTHGQLDHSMHAPFLLMAGKKENKKIVCTSEVGTYFELFRKIPGSLIAKMQKGGTKDFGFAKITMVHADHPSSCVGPQGVQLTGGAACGYIVNIPNHNITFYHMGDTNIFSDMKLIDTLYKPSVCFIPVGDCLGMGPRLAAHAAKNFLPTVKTFIPMHFGSFPVLTGTPEQFEKECKSQGLDHDVKIIHPKNFFGGAAFVE